MRSDATCPNPSDAPAMYLICAALSAARLILGHRARQCHAKKQVSW